VPAVTELLQSPYPIRACACYSTAKAGTGSRPLLDGIDVPVYIAPEAVLRATLGFNLHRGVWSRSARPHTAASRRRGHRRQDLRRRARAPQRTTRTSARCSANAAPAPLGVEAVVLEPGKPPIPSTRRCVSASRWVTCLRLADRAVQPNWPGDLQALRDAGFHASSRSRLTPMRRGRRRHIAGRRGRSRSVARLRGASGLDRPRRWPAADQHEARHPP